MALVTFVQIKKKHKISFDFAKDSRFIFMAIQKKTIKKNILTGL